MVLTIVCAVIASSGFWAYISKRYEKKDVKTRMLVGLAHDRILFLWKSSTKSKEESSMLSNKTYDVLKWIALYLLPALGTLYFALAGIWNFPYGEEVVGTITAVDTFLGVLLGISTAQYKKENAPLDDD